jgi:hypothetical protein
MRNSLLAIVVLLLLVIPASSSPAAPPSAPLENLAGLAAGAMVVQRPEAPGGTAEAWFLFDEDPRTGWTSEDGKTGQPTVVELSDRSVIRSLRIDTANDEYEGRLPKQILVEMSDTGATAGFHPIATVTLSPELKDGQTFPVSAEVPGRWLRMTVQSMRQADHGIVQIMELEAFGERLTHNPPPDVTGTYDMEGQIFHLKQDGTTVTGCYDQGTAPLQGGMEGRLLRFTYETETDKGPAIAVFGGGGMFFGYWKANSEVVEHPTMWASMAKKTSDQPGGCPQRKAPQAER